MLGQVDHGFNDINKFYRNFILLKFKVTLQDTQYICSKQILMCQLTNVTVSKFHSEEVNCIVTIKSLICSIKPFRTMKLCICVYFFKGELRFSLLSFIPSSFVNLFIRIILFWRYTNVVLKLSLYDSLGEISFNTKSIFCKKVI